MPRYRLRIDFDAATDDRANEVLTAVASAVAFGTDDVPSVNGSELLREESQPWLSYRVLARDGTLYVPQSRVRPWTR